MEWNTVPYQLPESPACMQTVAIINDRDTNHIILL